MTSRVNPVSLVVHVSLRRRALALAAVTAAIALSGQRASAQTPAPMAREVPARTLPVPSTVSPQAQKIIGAPISPTWNVLPKTAEEWKAQVNAAAAEAVRRLPGMREQLQVKSEPLTIDGVKAYALTPQVIPPENSNRLLIHVHGGCYVSNPGESGTTEAVLMAGFGRFKVISVDYRMPPDHPYPAALR